MKRAYVPRPPADPQNIEGLRRAIIGFVDNDPHQQAYGRIRQGFVPVSKLITVQEVMARSVFADEADRINPANLDTIHDLTATIYTAPRSNRELGVSLQLYARGFLGSWPVRSMLAYNIEYASRRSQSPAAIGAARVLSVERMVTADTVDNPQYAEPYSPGRLATLESVAHLERIAGFRHVTDGEVTNLRSLINE